MYWKDVAKSLNDNDRAHAENITLKINEAVANGHIDTAKKLANELETIQRTQWMVAKQNEAASRVQSIDTALLVGVL